MCNPANWILDKKEEFACVRCNAINAYELNVM